MKKILLVCLFLVFAVLMLPGIIQPPGEVSAAHAAEVRELAHGLHHELLLVGRLEADHRIKCFTC